MIIRKPYAFLIKYFKLIHILLFILMSYLTYKSNGLYIFFRDYAKSGTYTYYENMTFKYVNLFMIFFAIILIGLLLLILLLMKKKEKKVLYYILATVFYSALLIIYMFFISVFSDLEFKTYSNQYLVFYRDITFIFYYLNYIFLTVAFIRGFGFNIKKFNFEKDVKELDISEEDREEIEVSSVIDYEDVGDFLRKGKRNIGYYIKENSYILIVFMVILSLFLGSSFFINKFVTNKIYKLGNTISINEFDYVINNSYVIEKKLNGDYIKKGKYFLIIDFNIKNNSSDSTISIDDNRINVNDKYYYPKTNVGSVFEEFGVIYKKQLIKNNSNNNYILVFELDENPKNIMFQLFYGKKISDGDSIYLYKNVKINPYQFTDNNIGEYKINDEIDLNDTYYRTGKLKVINMEVLDKINYKYNKCFNETCNEFEKTVIASGNNLILKMEYNLTINKNIFNYIKYNNKYLKNITPDNYEKNIVLLEVPNTIGDDFELNFDIRGTTFKLIK